MASGRWVAPLDASTSADGIDTAISRLEIALMVSDGGPHGPRGLRGLRGPQFMSDLEWTNAGGDNRSHAPIPVERALEEGTPSPAGMGGAILASSGTTGAPKVIPVYQGRLLHTARYTVRRPSPPPLAQRQGIQSAAPLSHQCRSGRAARHTGGGGKPRARRPLPSDGVLGTDGATPCDLDQRGPSHRVPPGRSSSGRNRSLPDPLRPLGVGPAACRHPVPFRGEHGHPGARDLRHDRSGKPDHSQPAHGNA